MTTQSHSHYVLPGPYSDPYDEQPPHKWPYIAGGFSSQGYFKDKPYMTTLFANNILLTPIGRLLLAGATVMGYCFYRIGEAEGTSLDWTLQCIVYPPPPFNLHIVVDELL